VAAAYERLCVGPIIDVNGRLTRLRASEIPTEEAAAGHVAGLLTEGLS
jgi:hypothetical protein